MMRRSIFVIRIIIEEHEKNLVVKLDAGCTAITSKLLVLMIMSDEKGGTNKRTIFMNYYKYLTPANKFPLMHIDLQLHKLPVLIAWIRTC
jgi:hypothetical protein